MRFIQKTPLPESLAAQFAAKQATLDAGGTSGWNPSKEQKKRLGQHLLPIQKHICCYCEKQFDNNPHHIEHFIEQHDDKTKTYDYENLFLSCEGESTKKDNDENTSCGHKKTDSRHANTPINYNLLLNPANIATQNCFEYEDSGKIIPNKKSAGSQQQALYTIKRLNLDNQRLKNERQTAIITLEKEINGLSDSEIKTFLANLFDEKQTRSPNFYSALFQNFAFLLS